MVNYNHKIFFIVLSLLLFSLPLVMPRFVSNLGLKDYLASVGIIILFILTLTEKTKNFDTHTFSLSFFSPLEWAVLFLVILAGLSLIYTPTFFTSLQDFIKFSLFALFYFLVSSNSQMDKTGKFINFVLITILTSATIVAFFATCQHFQFYLWGFLIKAEDRNRMCATIGHNNGVASYLMMATFIALGFLLKKSSVLNQNTNFGFTKKLKQKLIIKKIALLALIIWFLFVILATLSRGVWLGTIVASLVVFSALVKSYSGLMPFIKKNLIIITGILCLLTIFIFFLSFKNPMNPLGVSVIKRFTETFLNPEVYFRDTRIRMWAVTLEMIKDHPIRGVGIGALKYLIPLYQGKFFAKYPTSRLTPTPYLTNYAHNEYLELWAELGFLGLFCGVIALYSYFSAGKRFFLNFSANDNFLFFASIYAGTIGVLVQSLVDFPLHISPLALLFIFLVAIFVANSKGEERILYKKSQFRPSFYLDISRGLLKLSILCSIIVIILFTFSLLADKYRYSMLYYMELADFYRNKGNYLFYSKYLNQAIAFGKRSVWFNPHFGRGYYDLGRAYLSAGALKEGIYHLELALRDLQYKDLHAILAKAYQLVGNTEKAIEHYRLAVFIYPLDFEAMHNLALLLYTTGQKKQAIQTWQKLVSLSPNYLEEFYFPWAKKFYINSSLEKALELYEIAVKLKPNNSLALRKLARISGELGRYNTAIFYIKKALVLEPNSATNNYLLAFFYYKLGELKLAKEYAKKALQLHPLHTPAQELLKKLNSI